MGNSPHDGSDLHFYRESPIRRRGGAPDGCARGAHGDRGSTAAAFVGRFGRRPQSLFGRAQPRSSGAPARSLSDSGVHRELGPQPRELSRCDKVAARGERSARSRPRWRGDRPAPRGAFGCEMRPMAGPRGKERGPGLGGHSNGEATCVPRRNPSCAVSRVIGAGHGHWPGSRRVAPCGRHGGPASRGNGRGGSSSGVYLRLVPGTTWMRTRA
jgi:hypothetical protein